MEREERIDDVCAVVTNTRKMRAIVMERSGLPNSGIEEKSVDVAEVYFHDRSTGVVGTVRVPLISGEDALRYVRRELRRYQIPVDRIEKVAQVIYEIARRC